MITAHVELIKEVVTKIKANPTLTLAQYNNYLSGKPWYEQAIIRFFIYKLAVGLAQSYGVTLTDYTETQILSKVRDWIVATPTNKLAKIILNRTEI